jgi:hypothetical protein
LRDILTVIASLVILVLAVAVAAPPFIDWEAQRDIIDRSISRAAGTQAQTEGRIRVRLLPFPRVRLDRLRLGPQDPASPSLTADFVWSDIELMPLLRGEVRFTETRVGRADLRIPVSSEGSWRLPPGVLAAGRSRDWAIENLTVAQLLVTTQVPNTGRTDQFYAESVGIEGQSLLGPWRIEGLTAGSPFRVVTGALSPEGSVLVKVSGGGDVYPRFDIDAKIALDGGSDSREPGVSGKAKVLFGPPAQIAAAGVPIPIAIDTTFKTNGSVVELDPVVLEAGEGGASLRMTGTGSIRTDDPRIALKLEGRRLDADSFLISSQGQDFLSRLGTWSPPPVPLPVDLDLAINSIGLAQDELTNFVLRGSLARGRAEIERLEFNAPGETRVAVQASAGLTTEGGASGRAGISSAASDRLARYIERFRASGPFLKVLDGRPFEAASDFVLDLPVLSFRNVRIKAGDATLTGNARYTAPETGQRGRLEAQVAVRNLDVEQLPQVSSVFDATQNIDVGFILDARDVRAGNRRGAGRIAARILSDGPTLFVESLDIVDVAGANARVSGRIAADGSGRIAGKVTAPRAAPLVDLLGSVWIGGVSKLVPPFLREGDLNLDVVTERAVPESGSPELRLRTIARGTAAGGLFDGEVMTVDGTTDKLAVRIATENTGRWVERPDVPLLRRPSNVNLRGTRVGSGRFNVTLDGDIGGVLVTTNRPFALGADDDVVDNGEAAVKTGDLTPFLALMGEGARVQGPLPAEARISLGREGNSSLLDISGRIGGDGVQARLLARSRADIGGEVTLERLSLPWLVTATTLNAQPDPRASSPWSAARFGQASRLIDGGQATFRVRRLDLGRGLIAENANFALTIGPETLAIRDLRANLGGGQLSAVLNASRQGALATLNGEGEIRDTPLATLTGQSHIAARVSATLKFGTSGESFAGLVTNLGGAGDLRLTDVTIADADPGAIEVALARLLQDSDPLAARRAETVVAEELNRGPFRAPTVTAPIALIGGSVRFSPLIADGKQADWRGAVSFDLKTMMLDARGTLSAKAIPKGWTGSPPSIGLVWRGSFANPVREIDTGALNNGLATIVLQRELEKIELLELDATERQRRLQSRDLDRQRERDRIATEEAARQARLRAEAERIRLEAERVKQETERAKQEAEQRVRAEAERIKFEAEKAKQEVERARQETDARARAENEQRARAEAERRSAPESGAPTSLPALAPPIDIRPPPQIRPGG